MKVLRNKWLVYFLFVFAFTACKKKIQEHKPETTYSCSMHPSVKQDSPGTCPVCHMDLAPVNTSHSMESGLMLNDEQIQLAGIRLDTVKSGEMSAQTVLAGTATENANSNETISARVQGRITHLYVKETGQQVKKGQLLYSIYSEDLLATEKEYLLDVENAKNMSQQGIDFNKLALAAKQKLLLWGLSESQIASIREETLITDIPVYSRQDGIVTSVKVFEGDYVMEGSPVLQLTNLSSIWVEAQLYPEETHLFQPGNSIELRFNGFEEKIKGKVLLIQPELASGTQLGLLRIEVPNPEKKYQPGMQAYVYWKSPSRHSVSVPQNAVLRDAHGALVWVMTKKGHFESRMVYLGNENKGKVEIISGLKAGEQLVVAGAYLLNSEYILQHGANPHEGMKM